MEGYGWNIETQGFNANTPYGSKNFVNLIATLPVGQNFNVQQSDVRNRVVFACHFDSKLFTQFKFVAATDSAVPCAMMLDMAQFFSENFNNANFNNVKF